MICFGACRETRRRRETGLSVAKLSDVPSVAERQTGPIGTLPNLSPAIDLGMPSVVHLHRLVPSWDFLGDLAFADLLLFAESAPSETDGWGFRVVGQARPTNTQSVPSGFSGRPEPLAPAVTCTFHRSRRWARATSARTYGTNMGRGWPYARYSSLVPRGTERSIIR